MQVDLPFFESVEALVEETDAIVAAKVLSSRSELELPDLTSNDPQVNPYVGASATPLPEELTEMGVPVTVYEMEITESFAGRLTAQSNIEVVEMGGIIDGVEHRVVGLVPMTTEVPDLLFLEELPGGRYTTVGVAQGGFDQLQGGGYVSVSEPTLQIVNDADLERLAQLVGG